MMSNLLATSSIVERQRQAAEYFNQAGIYITPAEQAQIEIAEFGLDEFERTGLGVLVYINNERYCAKELAMWPRQTCPEHRHPAVGGNAGKQETFRCRWGTVYLYVSGEPVHPAVCVPPGDESMYTVWHQIKLEPGEQYTIAPDTLHWFQAGDSGAVVSEFSSTSTDENDVFTDARIRRLP